VKTDLPVKVNHQMQSQRQPLVAVRPRSVAGNRPGLPDWCQRVAPVDATRLPVWQRHKRLQIPSTTFQNQSMGSQRRVIDDQLYVHFVTFSVDRRRRLLDHDHPKRILLGVLNKLLVRMKATCVGFVVMPDHVHALIWFSETGQLSKFMHEWKRQSSLQVRKWYRNNANHYAQDFGEGERFWQPKYHAFTIESEAKIEEKLAYMHLNPVRGGLVENATDWKWSSARWYTRMQTVGVPIGWPGN